MSTAEEIKSQITAARNQLNEERRLERESELLIEEARTRRQLRRQLKVVNAQIHRARQHTRWNNEYKTDIDNDDNESHMPDVQSDDDISDISNPHERCNEWGTQRFLATSNNAEDEQSFSASVSKGEYQWRIHGMSWLPHALSQQCLQWARSPRHVWFRVGTEEFEFVYNPSRGRILGGVAASLCIRHNTPERWHGITFRYRVFVRCADGEFVQWGHQGDICLSDQDDEQAFFGPDIQAGYPWRADGIFGLAHEELLQSDWVQDDALTVKFEMEVRAHAEPSKPAHLEVEVPSATICSDLLTMLEEGKWSDVNFSVKGESIKAHSQVLCPRSQVFERQLYGGMRESVSKEVVVEDCEPHIFKAFLQFLYTDDFSHIEKLKHVSRCNSSTGGTGASASSIRVQPVVSWTATLQDVLAVSHKYQNVRLMHWCEQQLCNHITVRDVCSVLCQAHLCEAKHLEEACLKVVKENVDRVFASEGFGRLAAEWPQVLLKIGLWGMGASASTASSAVSAQQVALRKRKREGD